MTNDPLLGRQLANYRIEHLIGRGGMASVYYATDIRLSRPVAVKVIDAHFRDKEAYTARFVQEARAVATWRHEHIIQIYYAGDEDGLYYFAMEYIDGTTLAQILSDHSAVGELLPAGDVLLYGRAIASALDYAHSKGVVHRDVKPLNVLLSSDGRVVLTDFGLALDTAQGSLGEVFGSAHYTAPEQARRSNAAVPQSDLYSLGVILYEMLTGVVPFDDPSPTSVALQQITQAPPPPRQINPKLNAAIEAVLLRALEKDPVKRYPTGEALIDALETALQAPTPVEVSPLLAAAPLMSSPQPAPTPSTSIPAVENTPTRATMAPSGTSPATPVRRSMRWLLWMGLAAILCLAVSSIAVMASLSRNSVFTARIPTLTASPDSTPIVIPSYPTLTPTNLPKDIQTTLPPTPLAVAETPLPSVEVIPPSSTPLPTVPSVDQPPTPTLRYTDRRRFKLYYNETSFYMQQLSGVGDLIAGVAFERLDATGQTLNRFSGNRWAKYSQSSLLDWCFRLEISGAVNYLRPLTCEGKYMATLNPETGDPGIFWTANEGSTLFRVLWQDEELVRCEISAGTCEVYLP